MSRPTTVRCYHVVRAMRSGKNNIRWLLALSIIFMHFMIASPLGFPLTIIPFVLMYFVVTHFRLAIRPVPFVIAIALVLWPFLVLVSYKLLGGDATLDRFVRTYTLWAFALIIMVVGSSNGIKKNANYSREFLISAGVIILFSIAQVLSVLVFNTTVLYYPFGEYSYLGVDNTSSLVLEKFARAPGFYLEPSFNAFVLFFLLTAILIREVRPRRIGVLIVGGLCAMFIVGSATGILAVGGLACLLSSSFIKRRIIRILFFLSLLFVLAVGAQLVSPQRLAEVGVEGTSGYWRLVAPLIILSKVYVDFPMGIPFGEVENFVVPLGIQHGAGIGSSIDNGMYYLVFSFGWIAFAFFIWLFLKMIRVLYIGNQVNIAYWWFVIASLQFSGGILLPEYIYPVLLLTYTYRVMKSQHQLITTGIRH